MDLSKLTPAEGSVKNAKKRLGRGQGSGKGGTSTKGHKGAQSRSGTLQKEDLKVVRCHYKDVFQNSDSKILTGLNIVE